MEVDETSPHRANHNDKEYMFCSEPCLRQFQREPGEFVGNKNTGKEDEYEEQRDRGSSWKDYIPLMVIVTLTLLAACTKQYDYAGDWDWMAWMHDSMGFFLVVFSMFKFFNMEGFADGFQMYDLLAKPFRPYAYVYPFIELGLGLGYLSHWQPQAIYAATVVVMAFGSLGVIRALMKGLDINCACMGTVLKVPLSTVALTEDLGMAAMAATMLMLA